MFKSNVMSDLKLLSLFDGVGGFPLAWANVNKIPYRDLTYHSSEIEPFLVDIISANFPKSKQLFDVSKIDIEELKKESFDIITMGTPCTGFSISGKREGLANAQSMLFTNGVDIINKLRPKYFIWENVFGVFTANERKEYREILNQFKSIGYDTAWSILDSKFFDVPQRRRRVYVIGVRDGISKSSDVFDLFKRQHPELISESKNVDDFFVSDLNKQSEKPEDHYAFYNRQRSDKFKEIGISCTLAKRDYKGSTDLLIKHGDVRRIVPKERLLLQAMPVNWFDHSYEKYKSDINRFKANGMTVTVVEYVFEQLLKIENGTDKTENDFKKTIYKEKSAYDVCKGAKWEKGRKSSFKISFSDKGEDNKSLTKIDPISNSGIMFLDRDANGHVISKEAEYHIADKCSESSPNIKLRKIEDCLLDKVEDKFYFTENAAAGILKREAKSGNIIPRKLKDVIFHKHPNLKKTF